MTPLLLSFLLSALPAAAQPVMPSQDHAARQAVLRAAAADLEVRLAAEPKAPELWRRLGHTYQHLGEALKARDAFLKLVELKPEDARAWFMLGLVYEKLEDRPAAAAAWEKCLRFTRDEKAAETARRHLEDLRP
ncbi:MAG TPA: hypothetical protein DCM05_14840 [Elusimicrobia bacterium]|nr:hypothetical protein [Elusimicrobiota bacterium]